MSIAEKRPVKPLEFIKRCVNERRIFWTYHVNMRLRGRSLSREAILDSADALEIIEEYPEDKYLPSYLVYSQNAGVVFHILFAVDVEGNNVRVITAYRPTLQDWRKDLKTRR